MKMLAKRMSLVVGQLISANQYGFMKGRLASESILVVNEVCHSLKMEKSLGLILKIDFEKAFDSVDRAFLSQILGKFGFGAKYLTRS